MTLKEALEQLKAAHDKLQQVDDWLSSPGNDTDELREIIRGDS